MLRERIAPDEPMFILLGRDPHAGALVRLWAETRRGMGEDPKVVAEALECANALDTCAKERGKTPKKLLGAVMVK